MVRFNQGIRFVVAGLALIVLIAALFLVVQTRARAQAEPLFNYTSQRGVSHVACSSDGKYVFVVGDEGIVRSSDYGKKGTWEKVLSED